MSKNIIGVCLSQTHVEISREFLKSMHKAAMKGGYRLMVFGSAIDFKYRKSRGAEAIFHMIPYEKLDALVILHSSIHDERIINEMMKEAYIHDTPVIMARGIKQGAYSVVGRYENAFSQMIEHLVKAHGAKDFFYISGRENLSAGVDSDSARRYHLLKDTLKSLGIEMDDSNVACGQYWEYPTIQIIDELLDSGRKMPDAIVCANDIMALAASNRLIEKGIKVPDKIIVTGVDGLECARFADPELTTCREDIEALGQQVIKMVNDIKEEDLKPTTYYYEYLPEYSQTCGCPCTGKANKRSAALYQSYRLNEVDEELANRWMDELFKQNSIDNFVRTVQDYLVGGHGLYMRIDDAYLYHESLGEEYTSLPDALRDMNPDIFKNRDELIEISDIIDKYEMMMSPDSMCIFSTVYVNEMPLGIYAERITDIYTQGVLYNRHLQNINRGLLACLTQERHNKLKDDFEKNKFKDSLTSLDNIRGFQRWFEDFAIKRSSHERYFGFCVFSFINRDEIMDKYKSKITEDCDLFISRELTRCHPDDSYLARISATGFVVIVFAKDNEDRMDKIYSSVEKFYNAIMNRNEANSGSAQIEVSSGSVDVDPGWDETLSTFISSGYMELYKNRMAMYENRPAGHSIDIAAEQTALAVLNTIIRDNLLTYYFQPIVDAHSGEIVAYEALMRVTGEVKLSPLELLSVARRHRRLGAIEHLTMYNILKVFKERTSEFKDRSVFINTIPGEFVDNEHLKELRKLYADYLDRVVIEITEDNSITQDELKRIKAFGGEDNSMRIAVDDYGTGHSNVMNLMNYQPQVVKIDRFLIAEIQDNTNKQMFVSSIINFARDNNIKVLAEGVETKEELAKVIELGVDLIQGYYTGRPNPDILDQINESVKNEILVGNTFNN